jgi:SAM-dependent methyltransferase
MQPSNHQHALKNYEWEALDCCPICGGASAGRVRTEHARDGKTIVHWDACSVCGLHYQNPMMTDAALHKFYSQHYSAYVRRGAPSIAGACLRLINTRDWLLPYFGEVRRCLEIGSGFGYLLWAIQRERGAEVLGVEPDDEARAVSAREFGAPAVSRLEQVDGKFDLIVSTQTLEHTRRPLQILSYAHDILAESNGRAYFEVPNRNYREVHILSFDLPSFHNLVTSAGWTVTFEARRTSNDPKTKMDDLILVCHA